MAYLNPMLLELREKLQDYNKDVEKKIDGVAKRQMIITTITVILNLLVLFLSNYYLPDETKEGSQRLIPMLSNGQINILLTVLSMIITVPMASRFVKKQMHTLSIDENLVPDNLNYAGTWTYHTEFRIQSPDDGSAEYDRFCKDMTDYKEDGSSVWTQNVFDLKIDFATTNLVPGKPRIIWHSDPVFYDEHTVRWSFGGKVWWSDTKTYANDFNGVESYIVTKRDAKGRPCHLDGRLVGTMSIGEKFYAVDAVSWFEKK